MIVTEQLAPTLAADISRPSARSIALPCGPSADDRRALVRAIAELLLEIRAWPSASEVGDSSHLILDTEISGEQVYVQFLSEPDERGVLCEIVSGFYTAGPGYRPTPGQREAMVSHGFSDGLKANFRKELVFDAPDAATTIAEQVLSLIGSALGWSPESAIKGKITHCRRACAAAVFDGLTRSDVVELLTRHGVEARAPKRGEGPEERVTVEGSIRGRIFTFHLGSAVEGTSRYRVIVARAHVGEGVEPAAANPFNAATTFGRSWVSGGQAYVEASLRVVGITEDAIHHWLDAWGVALATAKNWYRRIAVSPPGAYSLSPFHFDEHAHNVQRMARCHVKPAAEGAAFEAFVAEVHASKPSEGGQVDAWSFFERYAAAHPDVAMPIEARFLSSAKPADLVSWLDRIDGVEAKVNASGDLEVSHVVPGGTLVLAPRAVRRVALCPERFAVLAGVEANGSVLDVAIGTDDFYFAPAEATVKLGSITFEVDEMPALVSWLETRLRLRSLEREIAWAGAAPCGGPLAWLSGALAGAERVGLACEVERARFEVVLAGAERSWRATIGQ